MDRRNRQEGNALLVTVMLLVLLGAMGISALDLAMRDQQVAGFQNRSRLAFYAAEAGLARGRDLLLGVASSDDKPPLPATSLGDSTIYPYGQPSYQGDPAFADPIRSIGVSLYTEGVNLRGGRPLLLETFWQINAIGQTPGGATSRIESVITSIGSDSAGYGG